VLFRSLNSWTQRACGAAGASRQLAATPPAWAGFAARNAELAAALAGSAALAGPLGGSAGRDR